MNNHLHKFSTYHTYQFNLNFQCQIFAAVEKGDLERVEQLIKVTGLAVTRVKTGCTLLHAAAATNQPHMVQFLLQLINPNIVNKEGQTPAHLAAMKGHTQVLRILLADEDLNHDKNDYCSRTYKDWVSVYLECSNTQSEILYFWKIN